MTARNFANQSTAAVLTGAVTSSDATIVVSNYTGFPTPPYTAAIEKDLPGQEVVLVTAVAGANLTVIRGYDGTTAQAHAAATVMQHVVTALDAREANVHVNDTEGTHGLPDTVSFVGTTNAQTLTNKTIRTSTLEVNSSGGTAALASATAGTTGFLFRGAAAGVDKFTVTETGAVVAAGAVSAASVAATTATVSGNETVGGTLGVTGASTLAGVTAASLTVTGNTTHTGTLTQTGAATVGGALTVGGPVLAQGTLGANGDTTLATTATGPLTAQSAVVTGAATVNGNFGVVGSSTLAALTATSAVVGGKDFATLPKGVVGYASRITSQGLVTAMTLITSLSASSPATTDSRRYKITLLNCGFYCDTVPHQAAFELGIDGVNAGQTRPYQFVGAGITDVATQTWYVTPSTAAHTFTIYMGRIAGVGQVGIIATATNKIELLVEDVGRV